MAFHAALLGVLAFGISPSGPGFASPGEIRVVLIDPPPFVRLRTGGPAPRPEVVRLVAEAPSERRADPPGDPADDGAGSVDLFGPVFADGMWPRPVLVRTRPCDPKGVTEADAACRRDRLLIGLASDAAAGANARP